MSALDQIDALVRPGDLIEEADRGYVSPWMAPEVRRNRITNFGASA
jgi:hypothetical protein